MHGRPTIGVLVGWQVYSGTFDSFLDRVFHGILAGVAERECNLMLACGTGLPYGVGFGRPAWPFTSPVVDFIPVGPWNCDGLIILPPIATPSQADYANELIRQKYPLIFSEKIENAGAVTVDNYGGIMQAMDHLVAHGHRRIAFIHGCHGSIDEDSRIRFQAYREALQKHGLVYAPGLVASGYHSKTGGQQAMHELLNRKARFTAMIGSNDESTIGAMDVLQQAGYLVPQDVAVIGFDDRIDARAQIPMLTTIHFPMFDLGYQAVHELLNTIEGKRSQPRELVIPTRLVIRGSCGCVPGTAANTLQHPDLGPNAETRKILEINASESPITAGSNQKQEIIAALTQAIIRAVGSEEYHLGLREVDHLSQRLVEALQASLERGNPAIFSLTFQQILARTSAQNDDLFTWHKVTRIILDWLPALLAATPVVLTRDQALDMLNQIRVTISEISQGQIARQTVRLEYVANQLGEMSARFFTAQDETLVFAELHQRLPAIGIAHAAVAFYSEANGDAYALSQLQTLTGGLEYCNQSYPTRQFPPEGLYPAGRPFTIAILPMMISGVNTGYAVFETGNLAICANIVQQLSASLKGIQLYRDAIEARQIAEQGKRMAEEANRLKNRFLSWVIHELRTPLNLIYGLSDMLLQDNSQPRVGKMAVDREDIERIHLGGEHLVNLIRDVLDLASSELGQLRLVRETLDMKDELLTIASIGSHLARDKNLTLRTEIEALLPPVYADRTRIRQVILNLLNNAVKFTGQGEIILRAHALNDVVLIAIQDTGLGIPFGEQERIFEEFQQSERTSARGFGGLGLGLAICKRLVEMHGGEIGVQSSGEEGKGSTFFFTLPAVNTQPQPASPASLPILAQRLLLLVSDAAGAKEIKKHLNQRGFETQILLVDDENDWMVKVLQERPQAIVLEAGLASRLGWEVLKVLKENQLTLNLPVMFCFLKEETDTGSMLELDYLTKPISSTDLGRIMLSRGILEGGAPSENKKTILIVDDDSEILGLHSRMVQAQYPKSEIILAHNGREALQVIRKQRPDLVLLDLMMPEIDGFTVLEMMQKDDISRNIPVVVLTGQALSEGDMQRLNCGVTSVLGKGLYTVQETMNHVIDGLNRRRKAGSETQRIVLKAMTYLHANYAAPITRKDVAEYAGLSERHLTRCFNLELGLTPMTYLNRYRVRQAKELLETGHKSMAEIAEIVGFSSGGYFTRVFRDEVGLSPRDYARGKR